MTLPRTEPGTTTPDEREKLLTLQRIQELRKEAGARQAADNFFDFQRYVMKSPDGTPWIPGEIHRVWDEFFSANPRAVFWAPIEHGKTEQRSIAKTLWLLGRNPNLRQVVISETYTQVKKICAAIKEYLEQDDDYMRVFPNIHTVRGKWTETSLTVQRDTISKDPSVLGQGVLGGILGARMDRVCLDDIVSFLNTLTQEQRDKTYNWVVSTLVGRLVDGGTLEAIGTAWHHDDAMHRLAKLPAYTSRRFQATEVPVLHRATEVCGNVWPAPWS